MAMLITLVPTTNVSAASVAYMTEDPNADLYPFPLDMNFLSNYLYGSSENTKGNVATYYAKEVPKEWLGKTIGEIDIRRKYNINIMATKKNGELNITISPDVKFTEGQTMLVLGSNKDIQKCFHI